MQPAPAAAAVAAALTPAQRKTQLDDLAAWLKACHPHDVLMVRDSVIGDSARAVSRVCACVARARNALTSAATRARAARPLAPRAAGRRRHQEAKLQARGRQLDLGVL